MNVHASQWNLECCYCLRPFLNFLISDDVSKTKTNIHRKLFACTLLHPYTRYTYAIYSIQSHTNTLMNYLDIYRDSTDESHTLELPVSELRRFCQAEYSLVFLDQIINHNWNVFLNEQLLVAPNNGQTRSLSTYVFFCLFYISPNVFWFISKWEPLRSVYFPRLSSLYGAWLYKLR